MSIRARLFRFPDLPSLFAPPLSPPTNYLTEGSGARLGRIEFFRGGVKQRGAREGGAWRVWGRDLKKNLQSHVEPRVWQFWQISGQTS